MQKKYLVNFINDNNEYFIPLEEIIVEYENNDIKDIAFQQVHHSVTKGPDGNYTVELQQGVTADFVPLTKRSKSGKKMPLAFLWCDVSDTRTEEESHQVMGAEEEGAGEQG